jgi:hypothetical protein
MGWHRAESERVRNSTWRPSPNRIGTSQREQDSRNGSGPRSLHARGRSENVGMARKRRDDLLSPTVGRLGPGWVLGHRGESVACHDNGIRTSPYRLSVRVQQQKGGAMTSDRRQMPDTHTRAQWLGSRAA